MTVLGLCCCMGFSLVAMSRVNSHCRALVLGPMGFIYCSSLALEPRDPTETEPELCLSLSCGGMGQHLTADKWQRSLACCSPWGHKASDTTDWLNWTGSRAQTQQLWQKPSCSVACGILQDQALNLCLCIGRQILYHWAPREALSCMFFTLTS